MQKHRVRLEQSTRVTRGNGTAPEAPPKEPPPAANDNVGVLAFPKPVRHRDKQHLRFVASQPCLVCKRRPAQAHHLTFVQPRALALKTSDEWAVPLCKAHHRAAHDVGDEEMWWKEQGIDPKEEAQRLWATTRPRQIVASGSLTKAPSDS